MISNYTYKNSRARGKIGGISMDNALNWTSDIRTFFGYSRASDKHCDSMGR